jgi:ELWxxDGT repeat protein
MIINGSTVNSLETLASITMNTGGDTLDSYLVSTNGEYLYFNSDRGISGNQLNLHVYSNSTNIVTQVTSYAAGDAINSIPSIVHNGDLYYFGSDGVGTVMYKLTGTTSTAIRTINATTKNAVTNPYEFDGNFYFSADDGVVGAEPWVSNGFAAGTGLLMNIVPGPTGSFPSFRGVVGDYLLISASNGFYRTKGPAGPTTIHFALPNMEYMNSSQYFESSPLANLTSWGLNKRYVVWIKETNP